MYKKKLVITLIVLALIVFVPYLLGNITVRIPNDLYLAPNEYSYWFGPYWAIGILSLCFIGIPIRGVLACTTYLLTQWINWVRTKES